MPTPPHYTPLSPDALAVARKLHDLVEPVLAHSRPPLHMPPVSSYDSVGADYLLLVRGIQLSSVLDAPNGSSLMDESPSYVNTPFGSVSWTPPIARTYWFETHVSMFVTTIAPALVRLRLVVGTQNIDVPEAKSVFVAGAHQHLHFMAQVTLATVAPVVIQWQWIGPAGTTLSANANNMRALRVWA